MSQTIHVMIYIYIYISAWTSFFVGGWPTKLETETQRSTKSKLFFEVTCQEVFVWGVDCLGEDLKNNNDAHISWMSLGFIDELWGDVEEAKNHWGLQRNQWDIYQITGQSNKPWDVPSFFWLPVWSLQTVCWCTLATGNFRKTPPMSQCQGICIDIYFWITWGSIIYIYIYSLHASSPWGAALAQVSALTLASSLLCSCFSTAAATTHLSWEA